MKMKSVILSICFAVIAITSFSQARVLTSEEKQTLSTDATFKSYCEWAVRDYASYWSIHDGASLSTESDRIKWAKDRLLSIGIIKNGVNDPNIALTFLVSSKAKELSYGTAPQSTSSIIATWLSNGTFDEFASEYFRAWGDDINFSIGN